MLARNTFLRAIILIFCLGLVVPLTAQSRRKGIGGSEGSNLPQGRKFAIIIGINEYKDPSIGNLEKAENDATGLSKILLKYGNFTKIQTIISGNKSLASSDLQTKFALETEFDAILAEMKPEDSLLFYFSGHGMTDYEEKNYLLAADSDLKSLVGTSLSLDDLLARTRAKGLKKILFILDACRNPDKTTQIVGPKFLANVSFSDVDQIAVFFSTKLGYYSYEDDKSAYGVFTKYLIYGLEGRADSNFNSEITFTELTDYVSNSLRDWSTENKKNQKPFVKYFGEKSEDVILTNASNPEFSLADLKVYQPYDTRYLVRSLALPGWGQYARGQEKKGKWMMWGSGVLYTFLAYSYYEYDNTRREYLETPGLPPSAQIIETVFINESLINRSRGDYQKAKDQLEISINLFLLYYAFNLMDFYFLTGYKENQVVNIGTYVNLRTEVKRESVISDSRKIFEEKYDIYFQRNF